MTPTPEDLAEAERILTVIARDAISDMVMTRHVKLLAQHFARVRTEAYARGVEEGQQKEGAE